MAARKKNVRRGLFDYEIIGNNVDYITGRVCYIPAAQRRLIGGYILLLLYGT
jgi:hypothetical protein